MGTPIYNLSQFRHLESFMCLVSDAITMCSAATSTPMFRIPHESTPGFMPFTDGGLVKDFFFNLQDYTLRNRNSMGIDYPGYPDLHEEFETILTDRATYEYVSCVSSFAADIGRSDQKIQTLDDANDFLSTLDDEENADYENFAREYGLGDSQFRVRIGCTHKEDEDLPLYFFVSLNIDDPYFRDSGEFRHQTGSKQSIDFTLWSQAMPIGGISIEDNFSFDDFARAHEMVAAALSKRTASGEFIEPMFITLLNEHAGNGLYSYNESDRDACEKEIASTLLSIDSDAPRYLADTKVLACHAMTSDEKDLFPPYHALGWDNSMIKHLDFKAGQRHQVLLKGVVGLHLENAKNIIANDLAEGWMTPKEAGAILGKVQKHCAAQDKIISGQPLDKVIDLVTASFSCGSYMLGAEEVDFEHLKQVLSTRETIKETPCA